ncbi:50S ribosomal protein L33 [bacterium]|nr:50S ribosomal protein L33 [bacterium]
MAPKKGKKRENIALQCTACKLKNYTTTKNKRTMPKKFEITKHCSNCNAHTLHRETKV